MSALRGERNLYTRIIVRNKLLFPGSVRSNAISLFHESVEELLPASIEGMSAQTILRELFEDEIETCDIPSSMLYQKFLSTKSSFMENEEFHVMYRFNDEFAIRLTHHIDIHHLALSDDEWGILASIVPWHYVDSCCFLGDTWWETDNEILENINKMTVVNFLKRYKGY